MAEFIKWKDFPGFVDPLYVVQYCVSILARDVYPNMEWGKFDIECSKAKPKEPCAGIKMYLQDLDFDADLCQEVRYYIQHPCKIELIRVVNQSGRRALAFMLEYLKLRGPLIVWQLDDSAASLSSISKTRCMIRHANCYMESLPELDHCACVALGRHLQHLLSVAYAHDMFFMKDVLSKLYGPIFIEILICGEMKQRLTPEKAIDYSIMIFKQMLESCPWYQFSPTETLKRTIYPTKKREFTHKYTELADHINNTQTLPVAYRVNLAEVTYRDRKKCPSPHISIGVDRREDPCYRPDVGNTVFPPDNCHLDFGPDPTTADPPTLT